MFLCNDRRNYLQTGVWQYFANSFPLLLLFTLGEEIKSCSNRGVVPAHRWWYKQCALWIAQISFILVLVSSHLYTLHTCVTFCILFAVFCNSRSCGLLEKIKLIMILLSFLCNRICHSTINSYSDSRGIIVSLKIEGLIVQIRLSLMDFFQDIKVQSKSPPGKTWNWGLRL